MRNMSLFRQHASEELMKSMVAYYSHTGNNRYLANRIARDLGAESVEIRPRAGGHMGLLLSSLTKIGLGIRRMDRAFGDYDSVVLCGPIWMGQLISPLSDFLRRYGRDIRRLHFVCCCGSGETTKDSKFGYNPVFAKVRKLMGGKLASAEAFSIELVTPEEMKGNGAETMKIRLDDANFTGKILDRYDALLGTIRR